MTVVHLLLEDDAPEVFAVPWTVSAGLTARAIGLGRLKSKNTCVEQGKGKFCKLVMFIHRLLGHGMAQMQLCNAIMVELDTKAGGREGRRLKVRLGWAGRDGEWDINNL